MDREKKEKASFIKATYRDLLEYYQKSINEEVGFWDYVVLTASNKKQASVYEKEIEYRIAHHLIPKARYLVIPDLEGKRIGSGGATLNLLKTIQKEAGKNFDKLKILVIHSGGDSKRIPQYSACGKIFSPVQRETESNSSSTLFDEFLLTFAPVYYRISPGVMILSGDVTLAFNPSQVDLHYVDAGAISIKESASTATNHGVFVTNTNGILKDFLHKKPLSVLKESGAVNKNGNVDIDTGSIYFGMPVVNNLLNLIKTKADEEVFINDTTRLSLYADLVYPLSKNSTLEQFKKEEPEGDFSEQLLKCREKIWEALHSFSFKVIKTAPSRFIHFGTTKELMNVVIKQIKEFRDLSWKCSVCSNVPHSINYCANTSLIESSQVGEDCFIEYSQLTNCTINKESIISNIDAVGITFPSQVCIHGAKVEDSFVYRIYGINDNPKNLDTFLQTSIPKILDYYGLAENILWESEEKNLWQANIYIKSKTKEEAIKNALTLYKISSLSATKEEVNSYFSNPRISLKNSYIYADYDFDLKRKEKLNCDIRALKAINAIKKKVPLKKLLPVLKNSPNVDILEASMQKRGEKEDKYVACRIYLLLSKLFADTNIAKAEKYEEKCYDIIRQNIIVDDAEEIDSSKIKTSVEVAFPVRANLAGGWSDTPPYCIDNGGAVLNVALKLNGDLPIWCETKRTSEPCIILRSIDLGAEKTFTSIDELKNCSATEDPFSLLKASLLATGIIKPDDDMRSVTKRLGGGLILSTDASSIPKGSGLGTSSILSGACLCALYRFVGKEKTLNQICNKVLEVEQRMSTGGGWQDQVGGLIPGIKITTTNPGVQSLEVKNIKLSKTMHDFFDSRYVLIYTGQRRLAKNLLRSIVEKYLLNDKDVVFAIDKIKEMSSKLEKAISDDDIETFCNILNEHWQLSTRLDSGFTNTFINHIISSCSDLIDAKMMCGAGGGGFLQVILSKGVSKAELEKRINAIFEDCGVKIYDAKIWEEE